MCDIKHLHGQYTCIHQICIVNLHIRVLHAIPGGRAAAAAASFAAAADSGGF